MRATDVACTEQMSSSGIMLVCLALHKQYCVKRVTGRRKTLIKTEGWMCFDKTDRKVSRQCCNTGCPDDNMKLGF